MGIDISVGVLVDISEASYLESKDFIDHYKEQFEAINQYLISIGLPEHKEPSSFGGVPTLELTATKELYPLRFFAEELESRSNLRFPHLLTVAHSNGGIFLPLDFDEVLEPDPSFRIEYSLGSAYKLHCECLSLAALLDIDKDFDAPLIDCSISKIDNIGYSLEDFNLIYEDGCIWPNGAGACYSLYIASHFSITHKAAIVIF